MTKSQHEKQLSKKHDMCILENENGICEYLYIKYMALSYRNV